MTNSKKMRQIYIVFFYKILIFSLKCLMLESYFPCHYNDVQKGFLIELAPEAVGTGGTGETGLAGTIFLLFVVQVQPLKKIPGPGCHTVVCGL